MVRFLIFFILSFSYLLGEEKSILCVDVGCSRIKAAVLSSPFTIESLKKTNLILMRSEGWKNERLPLLLSSNGLLSSINKPYSAVSFALPSPIQDHAIFLKTGFIGVPKEIKKAFETQAGCPVFVENDAVCHLRGALLWQTITNKPVTFPCAFVALGTWVGCAYAQDPAHIEDIEISECADIDYSRLKKACAAPTDIIDQYLPDYALNNEFLQFAETNSQINIQKEYQARLQAFLSDFQDRFKIKTVFIGGGNARLISENLKVEGAQVALLNDRFFRQYDLPPELIPLLGCFATAQELEKASKCCN